MEDFGEGTALVVGGSGGIGRAICRVLAESGTDVALTYHSNESAAREAADDVERAGRRARTLAVARRTRAGQDHQQGSESGQVICLRHIPPRVITRFSD